MVGLRLVPTCRLCASAAGATPKMPLLALISTATTTRLSNSSSSSYYSSSCSSTSSERSNLPASSSSPGLATSSNGSFRAAFFRRDSLGNNTARKRFLSDLSLKRRSPNLYCPLPTGSAHTGSSVFKRSLVVQAEQPLELPEEEEDRLEGEQARIDLTEAAIKQIVSAQAKLNKPDLALRLAVESGGCHGYQYKMEVTERREPDDYLFLPPSSTARVLIDSSSLPLLSGSIIDYATELIGSSFRIRDNPHASDKGGCGCGVSWELKE